MIKARGNSNGKEFVLLGLSYANLDRLRKDDPIVFDGRPYGIEMDVVIVAGETERKLIDRYITPTTKLNIEEDEEKAE